uniref:uncharacterized protein LOC122610847 n=1 Tax=Erigeron canadensis TaxID=72917 RepID=UPI001CB88CCB|nr:uncharacterized protein LOC122610847 [Erigeron canadensis]
MSSTYNYQTSNSNHSHANDNISDEEEFVDCEDNKYEDNNINHEHNGDFTLMYINENENNLHASADKTSRDSQTNSAFHLFDQNLLSKDDENQLPIQPHVDKVFIKSPQGATSSSSSTSEYDDCEGVALGPYRTWSKQENAKENVELNKKSNSTGFSKLWRLTGKVGRSNSDGRDAFVFLKRPADDRKTTTSSKMVVKRTAVGGSLVKANIDNIDGAKTKVVKIGTKAQNANVSAHEVYLRKKEQTEEERKRSYYLPYRPEIMGFFTNVNGGCLSKNVHPY